MTNPRCLVAVSTLVAGLAGGPAGAQTDPSAAPPAPAPQATPVPAPPSPGPETVTGLAAWEMLKGNTIEGKAGGDAFAEYFDSAGTVRYVDKDGLSTGTWTVQKAKVCFEFPEDDDRSCSTFTVTGAKGFAIDDDGETTRFEIRPGNSKSL